jgi:signal transduction histidine kinase
LRALPHLRFEIEDTGLGIPTERRNAMFEKFVRHDHKSMRGSNGAGLGLEMMNGKIGLESGPGGTGSLGWFTLPLLFRQSKRL